MITSTRPLITAQPGDLIEVADDGEPVSGDASLMPLETPIHAAVYRERADVGAVCRTHSPHAAGWGAREKVPPLILGLEGLSGEIALHHQPDLVTDEVAAGAAAADLGTADCLLIHSNGMVCTGRDLKEALVRAWFLEQRSATADRLPDTPALPDGAARDRARHYPAEAARAWNWIATQFGEGAV
jgi:ribulose-5-phosphate 4-epimerase/fuculose-1-phosphate aldolase